MAHKIIHRAEELSMRQKSYAWHIRLYVAQKSYPWDRRVMHGTWDYTSRRRVIHETEELCMAHKIIRRAEELSMRQKSYAWHMRLYVAQKSYPWDRRVMHGTWDYTSRRRVIHETEELCMAHIKCSSRLTKYIHLIMMLRSTIGPPFTTSADHYSNIGHCLMHSGTVSKKDDDYRTTEACAATQPRITEVHKIWCRALSHWAVRESH